METFNMLFDIKRPIRMKCLTEKGEKAFKTQNLHGDTPQI